MLPDTWTDKECAAYAAAIVDGEGCIFPTRKSGVIVVSNTEFSIIQALKESYIRLGIGFREYVQSYGPQLKTRYVVTVGRKAEIERFAVAIPIQSSRKQEKLAEILENLKNNKGRPGRPPKWS